MEAWQIIVTGIVGMVGGGGIVKGLDICLRHFRKADDSERTFLIQERQQLLMDERANSETLRRRINRLEKLLEDKQEMLVAAMVENAQLKAKAEL